jgi:predicted signal transduction protein with EAL and GGDEF domain
LRKQLERPINVAEFVIPVKLTLAVLHCPDDAENTEQLFRRMNIVVDHAQSSPDFIASYSEHLEQQHLRRLSIITELKKALATNSSELSIAYQPKLDLKLGKITGAEALLRWHSKKLGFVSPDEFIALAEAAGFIEQVTDWVLGSVIRDVALMKKMVPL